MKALFHVRSGLVPGLNPGGREGSSILSDLMAEAKKREQSMVKVKVLRSIQAGWFNAKAGEVRSVTATVLHELQNIAPGAVEALGAEPAKPVARPDAEEQAPDPVKARQDPPGSPPETRDRQMPKTAGIKKGRKKK